EQVVGGSGDGEPVARAVVPAGNARLLALAGEPVRGDLLAVAQVGHVTGDDQRLARHRGPGLLHPQVTAGAVRVARGEVLRLVGVAADDAVGTVGADRAGDVARRRG